MWAEKSFFYHIYPLGFCGAERQNDFASEPVFRLVKIEEWLPHIQELGADAIYLGPVFESSAHGYDTADYFKVDRRLGNNKNLRDLSEKIHKRGMRLIVDAVFNHVGRNFFAFKDVLNTKRNSSYVDWFFPDFSKDNHYKDGFCYEGWAGCDDIVKLNLRHPPVWEYLRNVIFHWIQEFDIDGIRLDAADCLYRPFIRKLSECCHRLKPDFWIMAECVYGDYTRLANSQMCNSVTNYELYQSLHSGGSQSCMLGTAQTLNRQFHKEHGVYRQCVLYNFLDNHDVSRIGTLIDDERKLPLLYTLLFTIPGIPSLYYGSEWAVRGSRRNGDNQIRPNLPLQKNGDLAKHIRCLSDYRQRHPVLAQGDFELISVNGGFLMFKRISQEKEAVVAVNFEKNSHLIKYKNLCEELPPYSSKVYFLD